MADLNRIILWGAVVVFFIVNGLLIYSLIRLRRKSAGQAESDQAFQDSLALETVWVLIPVAILVILLILTFRSVSG